MTTRYTSVKDLETALRTFEASVECFVFVSPFDLLNKLLNPPAGKAIRYVTGGENNLLVVYSTNPISGVAQVNCKGGHFIITTGTLEFIAIVPATCIVRLHRSAFDLRTYLATLLPGVVVNVWSDESQASGVYNRIVASPGNILTITGAVPKLAEIMTKGGQYVTIVNL